MSVLGKDDDTQRRDMEREIYKECDREDKEPLMEKTEPVDEVPCSVGLCAENAKLRQENIELERRLFFLGSVFIHYYEDDNGVCKLCRLKQDEVLHKVSA